MSRAIAYRAIHELAPAEINPKEHDQLAIASSINRFGFVEPIVIDGRTDRLVAGHGRLAYLLNAFDDNEAPPDGVEVRDGAWFVPVVAGWSSRSDDDAHAVGVALNQTTIAGGFDLLELAELLQRLGGTDEELVRSLGFAEDDLAVLLAADLPSWKPPDDVDDLSGFHRDDLHVLRFGPEQWEVVAEVIALETEDEPELTDADAITLALKRTLT